MENNYVVYHLHSDRSLLDSCTYFQDYIDKAVELKQKAIAFTEHGNIYNWLSKKLACDKAGIKYIHGVETYLTEKLEPKVRDNYHTILLAKNYEGLKEINLLMGRATEEDHFYYKPRITFDEFFNISSNVIKISACLASPLNKLPNSEIKEQLFKTYDYYEIQPHVNSDEQKEYNKYLYKMSLKYNKPLIMGTDTHSLNKYKAECRSILMKAKKIEFTNEDQFDLTYKSYEELVELCKQQNCFDMSIYFKAINNTNIMADSVENFNIDESFKYPILYGSAENDEKKYKEVIIKDYKDKLSKGIIDDNPKYLENIKEEFRVFKKLGMNGFMLFMSELIKWCHNNNIPTGFGRGSCCGSTIAYLTDIIDVDPVKRETIFARFCNENRKEIGDIDEDFSPDQREDVYNYIINRFGKDYTGYVLAIGTVAEKGCIDEIGRALNIPLSEVALIKEKYEQNAEETKREYPNLFYYFDGILNTAISQSMHPAGIIASPITLPDNYGEFYNDGKRILYLDMEEVHDSGLVKYDILGLKNIQIIRDVCALLNIPYPKSYEIDWNDKNVWNDIKTSPIGIFQFENNYAFDLMKRYDCKSIDDLTLINAALRPSGESYREDLINRVPHHNPSKLIDDVLAKSGGFLVYQEQTIQFLQEVCGLSGGDADNVRRAIGRKQVDRLNAALPSILEGYCKNSNKSREIAEQEAKEFLQVIEDSSAFQFGFNHATAYSMISYMCGYYRYHNPAEFICSYLNNANNMDDIADGEELARIKNINMHDIEFGKSKDKYSVDKSTNTIYRGLASIKFLNPQVSNELYDLSQQNTYTDFPTLLKDIHKKTSINSKQLNILILLDFFKQFGNSGKLLVYTQVCDKLNGKKTIKKVDESSNIGNNIEVPILNNKTITIPLEQLAKYCQKETAKQYSQFDSETFLRDYWVTISNNLLPLDIRLVAQKTYLGYITYTSPKLKDIYMVTKFETPYSKSKPLLELYSLEKGSTIKCKIKDSNYFDLYPLKENSIFQLELLEQRYKNKKETYSQGAEGWSQKEINMGYRWVKSTTETEWILSKWKLIK